MSEHITRFLNTKDSLFDGFYSKYRAQNNEFDNIKIIDKFGSADVGTTFTPVAFSGFYRTPQANASVKLRVKAGDINDTANGTGAREIYIEGINEFGDEVSELLATAGTSPGPASVNNYIRLYRAFVTKSGTYATQSAGSHAAEIIIERSTGGQDWSKIQFNGIAHGQTQVGAYTVPNGKIAFISDIYITVDATKTVDVDFFKRENILQTSAPYDALRIQFSLIGIQGDNLVPGEFGPFPANTDIGFLAKVAAQTAFIELRFKIWLFTAE